MSPAWKSAAGSFVFGAVVAFAYGGIYIYAGMRDAAVVQSESSASARVSMHTPTSKRRIYDRYSCDYSFSVNGAVYGGHENCSLPDSVNSLNDYIDNYAGVPQMTTATVYYDPADPSTNSLTEFGLKRDSAYMRGKLLIGVGVIFIILLVLGAVLASNPGLGGSGIVVDDKGTVIYPDKIDSGEQASADNSTQSYPEDEQSNH